MPLKPTPSESVRSEIAETIGLLRGHYVSSAGQLNLIVQRMIGLSDSDLAEFLDQLGGDLENLCALHAEHGEAVNRMLEDTAAVLGIESAGESVDIRPLADKLADQTRTISLEKDKWSVTSDQIATVATAE
jgi:hypothetical protein